MLGIKASLDRDAIPTLENASEVMQIEKQLSNRKRRKVRIEIYKLNILINLYMFDTLVNEFQKPGVYRIPCECGLVYIGETGRNLSLCLKEHKTNCEKAELEKSAVAKHSWTYDHRMKWNEASILVTESHKYSCKMTVN